MRHYTTVFDDYYAPKALALYDSLCKRSKSNFVIHGLCLNDEITGKIGEISRTIEGNGLFLVTPYSQFESSQMKLLKKYRSHRDFCWGLASLWTHDVSEKEVAYDDITYLDSDTFFFNDPELGFRGFNGDVAVVPHRFLKEDEVRLLPNGVFNVSWVTFKKNKTGLGILSNWAYKVLEYCGTERGQMGDQFYLDSWPDELGNRLTILPDGAGNGPWHIRGYNTVYDRDKDTIWIFRINEDGGFPLVMYHGHEHRRKNNPSFRTGYPLTPDVIKYIYEPYEEVLYNYEMKMFGKLVGEKCR